MATQIHQLLCFLMHVDMPAVTIKSNDIIQMKLKKTKDFLSHLMEKPNKIIGQSYSNV